MADALIGHSGFVGSTLLRQRSFNASFRSTNIAEVHGRDFDLVICAAAPAAKWIANRDPAGDRAAIEGLIGHLDKLRCRRFVLISTVDVFGQPREVDESTPVDEDGLHPYGLHRRMLEEFVEERYESLIVRLPGLVGPGLRKNVIYDFLNDNNIASVDSRGIFQFYPMVCLWLDVRTALANGLRLVHLTAAPVSVADISEHGFGRPFTQHVAQNPPRYDFRSRHAGLFGGKKTYQYTRRETLIAVRAYAQSEPRRVTSA